MTQIVTVEISMYPLLDQYEGPIIAFIKKLKNEPNIVVKTHAMSTYIQGPLSEVWKAIGQALSDSYLSGKPMSHIIKIIPRELPITDGWLEF